MADEGSTLCYAHRPPNHSLKNYHLAKWNQRISDKANSPHIKSLRDEIGILRMLLEEKLQSCTNNTELILQSGPIANLIEKIERVVISCHKLEGSMNLLMDKAQLLQFASRVVEIIGSCVQDQATLDQISEKILKELSDDSETS